MSFISENTCPKCGRWWNEFRECDHCSPLAQGEQREAAQPVCSGRGLGVSASERQPDAVSVAVGREKADSALAHPHDLMRRGGQWLAAARTWLQWNTLNGENVHWGSSDEIKPAFTVEKIEELAAHIAAAAINEERSRNQKPEPTLPGATGSEALAPNVEVSHEHRDK